METMIVTPNDAEQAIYTQLKERGFVPSTALDIGACKAQWSLMLRSVHPECAITMVEADARCATVLDPLDDVFEIHKVALGRQKGEREFFIRDSDDTDTWGSSSLYVEQTTFFQDNMKSTTIAVDTMDSLFSGRKFDLIKLDTQGSELEILDGGRSIWPRAQMIQMEVNLLEFNKGAPLLHDVTKYMARHGFYAREVPWVHRLHQVCCQIDLIFMRNP